MVKESMNFKDDVYIESYVKVGSINDQRSTSECIIILLG